jgi:2'-5' RNA ligase
MPPEEAWEPAQAIRRVHDRQIERWPPHVNLLYPFPEGEVGERVERARSALPALDATLATFRWFVHGPRSATVWLSPEPRESFDAVHHALRAGFPECDDLDRFEGGFRPHLSVGQAGGEEAAEALAAALQAAWTPPRFHVADLAWLHRDRDAPFRVAARFPLGPR